VLLALAQTETALVRYARPRVEVGHPERAPGDAAHAAELARIRFEAGATDLLDVLDAERTRLQAEDAFAAARTRSVVDAVALFKAMAGGWPEHVPLREAVADADRPD
jgi:outer membrane protein TolC